MGEQLTVLEHDTPLVHEETYVMVGAAALESAFAELQAPEQPALFWDDIDEVKKYVFQIPGQTTLDIKEV